MIMADKKTIGERIKFIRYSLGFNRSAFGRQLGSSSSSVTNWEKGHSKPAPRTLRKIARMGHTSVKNIIESDESSVLMLDKETALSLHSALYIILSNDRFIQSNQDDAKRLIDIDKKAMEVMKNEVN